MRSVWSIIIVICAITPFVQMVSPEDKKKGLGGYFKLPHRKGKDKAESSQELRIIGVFKSPDAPITAEGCQANCKTHFGEIVSADGNRILIGLGSLSSDKKTCSCAVNTEQIRGYFMVQKLDFPAFFHYTKYGSFCAVRQWLMMNKINVEIPYEIEAKKQKQKSPTEQSPTRTPQGAGGSSTDAGKGKSVLGTSKGPMDTVKGKGTLKISEEPMGTKKRSAGTSQEHQIIVGAFKSTGTAFTPEGCKKNCRTAFGYLVPYPGNRLPLTQPSVSSNGMTCCCFVNIEPLRDYLIEKSKDYDKLFMLFKKYYCEGIGWFEDQFMDIYLAYEEGLRPAKMITESDPPPIPARASKGPAETSKGAAETSKGAAGGSKGATGSGKSSTGASQDSRILMGSVIKMLRLHAVTIEECTEKCNNKFGFIVTKDGGHLAFTVPALSGSKRGCNCFLNSEPMKADFKARHISWVNFEHWAKSSYKDAVTHLTSPSINVKIEFIPSSGSKKTDQ